MLDYELSQWKKKGKKLDSFMEHFPRPYQLVA